jgi:hypothetical protein
MPQYKPVYLYEGLMTSRHTHRCLQLHRTCRIIFLTQITAQNKVKYTDSLKFHFKIQSDSLSHTHDQKSGKTFETKRLQELEEVHFRLTNLNQIWNCTEIDRGEHTKILTK